MNSVVNGAVQMCSMVYIMMGFFGYVAFCGGGAPLPGNVLIRLGSSLASEFIKLGFVATLVVSFPLCLFPLPHQPALTALQAGQQVPRPLVRLHPGRAVSAADGASGGGHLGHSLPGAQHRDRAGPDGVHHWDAHLRHHALRSCSPASSRRAPMNAWLLSSYPGRVSA
ncbi:hypothetical protein MRX96_006111 [Rhipicephalus microplus]